MSGHFTPTINSTLDHVRNPAVPQPCLVEIIPEFSTSTRTWQKLGIPQWKQRATKPAVMKLSCGPQTSKTCQDEANEHSRDVKNGNGGCGPYVHAVGGLH